MFIYSVLSAKAFSTLLKHYYLYVSAAPSIFFKPSGTLSLKPCKRWGNMSAQVVYDVSKEIRFFVFFGTRYALT